jgi:hypothetical protein
MRAATVLVLVIARARLLTLAIRLIFKSSPSGRPSLVFLSGSNARCDG